MSDRESGRRRRLVEELEESGLRFAGSADDHELLVDEVDAALHPKLHERRVPSSGVIVGPTTEPAHWSNVTRLEITRTPSEQPVSVARLFVDGLSSWLLRRAGQPDEWVVFDRPAGSERDLAVLAAAFGGTVVQRHPAGAVRIVGDFGILRWTGFEWHHEPPVGDWLDLVTASSAAGDREVLSALLEFAVHDLGAMGIGALLVHRPDVVAGPSFEVRLSTPPPLEIRRPTHLAPLRHALALVDGAAVFDGDGVLRQLGVRLVPSPEAEEAVDSLGGTRHTSARRYSRDDPLATVIAVSEDGPVTVLRNGEILGRSPHDDVAP